MFTFSIRACVQSVIVNFGPCLCAESACCLYALMNDRPQRPTKTIITLHTLIYQLSFTYKSKKLGEGKQNIIKEIQNMINK